MARRRRNLDEVAARRAALAGNTFDLLHNVYGEVMVFKDVCALLGCSPKAGYHQLRKGTFPIAGVYKNHFGRLQASTGDVAITLDRMRRENCVSEQEEDRQ